MQLRLPYTPGASENYFSGTLSHFYIAITGHTLFLKRHVVFKPEKRYSANGRNYSLPVDLKTQLAMEHSKGRTLY